MQRDREVRHERLLRETVERRQQAHRRQSDSARRDSQAVLVGEDPERLHRLVVVVQGLTHAHEHDVESSVAHGESAREHAHLADDLARGEIAQQPHFSGETEGARHGAADLGRDAEGHGRRVGDEDRLDPPAVAEAQQKFFGAVDRPLAFDELGREECERLGERRAQVASQIGHRAEVGDTVAINPPEDLARSKALVTSLGERLFERRPLQVGEVGLNGLM